MRTPSPKQEKVIQGLIANAASKNGTKSQRAILLEAGYSEKSAHNPNHILKSQTVLAQTKKFVDKLREVRMKALILADKKMGDAPLNHLTDLIDKSTKNMQLLDGKSTENVSIHVTISEAIAKKNQ